MTNNEEQEVVAALKWARSCNNDGIGYLGPTVKRLGPLPELAAVVRNGLLRCEEDVRSTGRRDATKCGYWITEAGLERLSVIEGG